MRQTWAKITAQACRAKENHAIIGVVSMKITC